MIVIKKSPISKRVYLYSENNKKRLSRLYEEITDFRFFLNGIHIAIAQKTIIEKNQEYICYYYVNHKGIEDGIDSKMLIKTMNPIKAKVLSLYYNR